MVPLRWFMITLEVLVASFAFASQHRDTLYTNTGDRIEIGYEIVRNGKNVTIRFTDFSRKLGNVNREKAVEDVIPLFFARTNVGDRFKFADGLAPSEMMLGNVKTKSDESYYLFDRRGLFSIDLELNSEDEEGTLRIPVYLAEFREKKNVIRLRKSDEFFVFARSNDDMHIRISKPVPTQNAPIEEVPETRLVADTQQIEVGDDLSDTETKALKMASDVRQMLDAQQMAPFSPDLEDLVSELKKLKYDIKDQQVASRIDEVLDAYEAKKDLISRIPDSDKARTKVETDEIIKKVKDLLDKQAGLPFTDELKTELDKLDDYREKAEDLGMQGLVSKIDGVRSTCEEKKVELSQKQEKKRNIWLIIGGVILAILGFGGNQYFQHRRNVQNNLSMEKMQNDISRRAESEARRRARSAVSRKMNQVRGEARRASRDMVKKSANNIAKNVGKGRKDYSI